MTVYVGMTIGTGMQTHDLVASVHGYQMTASLAHSHTHTHTHIYRMSRSRTVQCQDLQDYLRTLPAALLDRLYSHPTTCLAVYRELPEIARHYVIRIVFVEQPVPQAVVASWISQAYAQEHNKVTEVLSGLRVWQEAAIPGGLPGWILNSTFKKNLKIALLGGGKPWSMSSQLEVDSKPRDIPYLDSYAMERWECVLHYMVGSRQQEGISADAVRILLHAGLMKRDEEDGSPVITREGFQFLLLDTASQVWYFILQYLDTVQARGLDLVDCLTFLFQLSFSTMGKLHFALLPTAPARSLPFLHPPCGSATPHPTSPRRRVTVFLPPGLQHGGDERGTAGVPAAPSGVRPRLPAQEEGGTLLPDAPCPQPGVGTPQAEDGGEAAVGIHHCRDQLQGVRLHQLEPAGGVAGTVLRAHVQVPEPGRGHPDAGVGAAGAAQRHHGGADGGLPAAARAPAHGGGGPAHAAADGCGPDQAVGERAQPLHVHGGRPLQPVPVAGRLRGAARPRGRTRRARLGAPTAAHHGGDAYRPRRRQALLEALLQGRELRVPIDLRRWSAVVARSSPTFPPDCQSNKDDDTVPSRH